MMQGKKTRLIGGLLVVAALALATVSATAAQTQPTPASGGMMGGYGPGQGTGMVGGMGGFAPGGMMSGTWGPTAAGTQPTVTTDQATQIAQQWLDQYQAGSVADAPDIFPGYYTLHITRDGEISGMLSVNGYTGQVWFHTWHGEFVASTQAGL